MKLHPLSICFAAFAVLCGLARTMSFSFSNWRFAQRRKEPQRRKASSSSRSQRLRQGRQLASFYDQLAVLDFVLIFIETARRRARRVRSIFVKGPTMARAHIQMRLLEPANRAGEMRAADGKGL